jgi:dephospho-CoA kinase
VNRQTLGQQVFRNAEKRKLLESWIHPKTREQIEAFYEYNANHAAAVSIIPLLFESGLEKRYDEVWLIETPENLQIERLMATRQMSLADAQARISSQMPTDEKRKRAQQHPNHALIRNTGKPEDLYQQIDALLAGS